MTIHFYIDNVEETEIFTLFDQFVPPFKEGDEIKLSVDEPYPKDYLNNEKYDENLRAEHDKLNYLCHLKTAKIVRMINFAEISATGRNRVTVDYYCEILDK
jgi:hypothetical protein